MTFRNKKLNRRTLMDTKTLYEIYKVEIILDSFINFAEVTS